jgi:RNA processing factor Prp31
MALFRRALKTKDNTPKYGIIYHASIVDKQLEKIESMLSRPLSESAPMER